MEINKIRARVEESYKIPVDEIEKIKNVYKISSGEKFFCLKVVKYNFKHFLFIISAINHLRNNGFYSVLSFIKDKNGSIFINLFGNFAFLTSWVEGRVSNYDNFADIIIATEALANLHISSRGFQATEDMEPRVGWFKWINTFKVRGEEIIDFKRRIEKKKKITEFDNIYLKNIKEELLRAEDAIDNLISSEYLASMKKEVEASGFCHHDYAHHNVLIDKNNSSTIIDFDYCILDSKLHDLSSLIVRKMKNGKWDMKDVEYILSFYSNKNLIIRTDIPIMAAFMEFPQEFWQVGIQYYWEEKPWGEEFFLGKLNKIIEDREERQEFIDDFRFLRFGG